MVFSSSVVWSLLIIRIFSLLSLLAPTDSVMSTLDYPNDQPAPYAPAGVNPDGEVRAPVLTELRRDLVPANGPGGLYGVCTRVYRVLHHIRLSPAEECRRHYNSRQAGLGDMSEFYHTLVASGQFNQTLEFPLADLFGRFTFRASFVYLSSKKNEPAVMIETVTKNDHVLCVESIKCPTTISPSSTTPPTTLSTPAVSQTEELNKARSADTLLLASSAESGRLNAGPDQFWDALLAGTELRSWFLATVSLSILSLLLLIILLITWIYLCRIRRLYARRRCRGTCRFGCRCPPDVVRQSLNTAGVYGPIDAQNTQLFHTALNPQANGSIRSGSGFGTNLFSGGTMTSSRWGSNGGQKLGSPMYVSLANAQGKTTFLAPTPVGNPPDGANGVWHVNADQRPSSQLRRRRQSQDAICRSTSEGSSVSGIPLPNGGTRSHTHTALISGFVGTNNGGTGNASQNGDPPNSIYYQRNMANYPYSDGGTSDGLSPVTPRSPSQLGAQNLNELGYYGAGGTGPVGLANGTGDNQRFYPDATNHLNKLPGSSDQAETFNSYGSDSLHPGNTYPIRGSEGDLLNITPPSGFYDLNGSAADSALVNGSLASSSNLPASNHTTFANHSYLAPLYPIVSHRNGWRSMSRSPVGSRHGEMVGVVEMDNGGHKSEAVHAEPQFTFKPCNKECTPVVSSPMVKFPQQQQQQQQIPPTSRVYTASERML